MSEPLVSICCITYNHAAFIQQALSGFLMQQASFEYEIIVHDDCSTDGTTEILRVYEAEYPERMRVMYEEENQYSKGRKVFPLTLALARGKYVAVCEGDDYWTDPHKLQKQVDYLRAHSECSMCFHNVWVKYEDHTQEARLSNPADQKPLLTLENIVAGNQVTTCSVMFRRELVGELPGWYYTLPMGDWPLWVLLAREGLLGYVDDVMAVYRKHSRGVYSSMTALQWLPGMLRACDMVDGALEYSCHQQSLQMRSGWVHRAVTEYIDGASGDKGPLEATRQLRAALEFGCGVDSATVRSSLGSLNASYLYHANGSLNAAHAIAALYGLFRYDRQRLRNLGLWSLAGEAIIGKAVMKPVRLVVRNLWQHVK